MSATAGKRRGLLGVIAGIEDGAIIRTAFFAMLLGTAAVLFIDYRELNETTALSLGLPATPILPAFDPDSPAAPAGPQVTTDPQLLTAPLTVTLAKGGVLELTGTIDPGAFERVLAEVTARGEYVTTVALNSPGGSVEDAIKIGALLLVNEFTTSVAPGAICASSCPLILAGGKLRLASAQSAIGVHQIYAALPADQLPMGLRGAGDAISNAQKTTAAITRYLNQTGVDPALWLHALETPPERLYYFSPAELTQYRLITTLSD